MLYVTNTSKNTFLENSIKHIVFTMFGLKMSKVEIFLNYKIS
jgi:hypothetical protein